MSFCCITFTHILVTNASQIWKFLPSSIDKGQAVPVEADSLTRKLLDTYKCYLLDCDTEIYVWMGRNSSLAQRKAASSAAEVSPFLIRASYSLIDLLYFSHAQRPELS